MRALAINLCHLAILNLVLGVFLMLFLKSFCLPFDFYMLSSGLHGILLLKQMIIMIGPNTNLREFTLSIMTLVQSIHEIKELVISLSPKNP